MVDNEEEKAIMEEEKEAELRGTNLLGRSSDEGEEDSSDEEMAFEIDNAPAAKTTHFNLDDFTGDVMKNEPKSAEENKAGEETKLQKLNLQENVEVEEVYEKDFVSDHKQDFMVERRQEREDRKNKKDYEKPFVYSEFPNLTQIDDSSDDELEEEKSKNKFTFNFDRIASIRKNLSTPKEIENEDIIKISSKKIEKEWFNPKDSLLNLIPRLKLQTLRKYTDGKIRPEDDTRVKQAMAQSVTKNLENQIELPPLTEKERKSRIIVAPNAGPQWFNLPATELTEEVKEHFKTVKHRNSLYRDKFSGAPKGDLYPKYSVMGTFQHDAKDWKDRHRTKKKTFLQSVMEDEASQNWLKRKYKSIQDERKNPIRPDKKRKLRHKKVPYGARRNRFQKGNKNKRF